MDKAAYAAVASAEPSRFVAQCASLLAPVFPALDAPCGYGRNGLFLARRGFKVLCADHDLGRLTFLAKACRRDGIKGLTLAACNLDEHSGLPFRSRMFGAVLLVHFIPKNWSNFFDLLHPGGCLLIETMGGQGGNYLQLPKAGEITARLGNSFTLEIYREKQVGPGTANAVTVRALARKR
jgi:SAM-dependent methyltransferase